MNPHQSGMAAGYTLGEPHPAAKPEQVRHSTDGLPSRAGAPWSSGLHTGAPAVVVGVDLARGEDKGVEVAAVQAPDGALVTTFFREVPAAGATSAGTATPVGPGESAYALFASGFPLPSWRDDQIARAAWNAALRAVRDNCGFGLNEDAKLVPLLVDAFHPADVDARHQAAKAKAKAMIQDLTR